MLVRFLVVFVLVSVVAMSLAPPAPARAAPCDPPLANPIPCENSRPGAPQSEWDVNGAGDSSIQGFATDISINAGSMLQFKIETPASAYHMDIYRLGYYQGNGARFIARVNPSASLPQKQPACLNDGSTGLIDCGNWAVSAAWVVPADAISGIYIGKLVRDDGTPGSSHVVFVVRNDAGHSDVVVKTSDTTWQAYNRYGGRSLYTSDSGGPGTNPARAYKVSYNRPFLTRDLELSVNGSTWVFGTTYPLVRFLERNGYDVSYMSSVDADRYGALLQNHKLLISEGHDEYWSGVERTNFEQARDAGVHLAFLSGNEVFWKGRFEASSDGTSTPFRTFTCYKETHANAVVDPADPPIWTGTWRDPRFSPPADGGRPENALTGQLFTVNGGSANLWPFIISQADGRMRIWRNTAAASLTPGASYTTAAAFLGSEVDEPVDNGFRPASEFYVSSETLAVDNYILDFGSNYAPGTAHHHLSLYRAPSGALVFGAGSIRYTWALDQNHDVAGPPADIVIQQSMINLLADMSNIQPATLMAGLSLATQSGDASRPTSLITNPSNSATVSPNTSIVIAGSAADGAGEVAGVEVSTDGGATWHPAVGRGAWTYAWRTPALTGTVVVRSRAVDDSGNLEAPATGVVVTVAAGVSTPTPTSTALPAPSGTPVATPVPGTTLGNTHVGTSIDTDDANYMTGSPITTGPSAVSVSGISVYVGSVDTAPNNQYQLAIYADAAGRPGARLAITASGTLVANSWNALPLTATLAPNTAYWLLYNSNGRTPTVNNMRMDAGRANQGAYSSAPAAFGAWPTNFPSSTLSNNLYSMYLSIGGDGVPPPATLTPVPTATLTPTLPPPGSPTPTPTPLPPSPTPTATPLPSSPTSTPTPPASTSSTPGLPTLGNTHVGTRVDTGDSNWLNGSRITTGPAGFTVSSISVYVEDVDSSTANRLYQVAIYADANGRPGARLASSATGTLTARAWNTLPLSAALPPSASYWLIFNTNGRSMLVNNMRMDTATTAVGAWSNAGVAFGSWPQSFGAATLAPQNWSIFASGT